MRNMIANNWEQLRNYVGIARGLKPGDTAGSMPRLLSGWLVPCQPSKQSEKQETTVRE